MRLISVFSTVVLALPLLASAAPSQDQKDFATFLVKSGKEPKVKDATWMTDKNLYVGVTNDGTRRDGFADYICSVADDHGLKPQMVKVIDVVKVVRTGKFVELGKAYCK